MRRLARRAVDLLASLKLACVLLVLLGLLTWLGTLEQVHNGLFEVQKKYFESFVVFYDAWGVPIPLPGANLVLSVLFVNLLVGGVVRLRKGRATIGVLTAHLGIAILLVAGFVKMRFADEGQVTLFEGQSANTFQSHYVWELAVIEPLDHGRVSEIVVPQARFASATGDEAITLSSPDLPFALEVRYFMRNCQPLPKGPMFDVSVPVIDGVFLNELAPEKEAERNIAGAYLTAIATRDGKRSESVVWGAEAAPWTVDFDGRAWAIELRHERYPLPFTLALDDFTKQDHARTGMAKSFSSDVTVSEGESSRDVRISMNEPLRHRGLVVYQASWGPSNAAPGEALFSTFAVVRNPADRAPLVGCVVIAVGLVMHFARKLTLHVRREVRA